VHPLCLVLDFGAINHLDSTTIQEMKKVVLNLKSVFDHIAITNLRPDIYILFEDADIVIEHRFGDVGAAVAWWRVVSEEHKRLVTEEHTATARFVTDDERGEDDAITDIIDSSKGGTGDLKSDDEQLIRFNTPLLCLEDLPLYPL